MLLIVTALLGVWVVEQPHSSLIAQHKRFRWLKHKWAKMGVRATRTCFRKRLFHGPKVQPKGTGVGTILLIIWET